MKISKKTNNSLSKANKFDFSSLRIAHQLYDCDKSNMLFTIKDKQGNTFEKTAHEIVLNYQMIAAFSVGDILLISYIAGMEHADLGPSHLRGVL